MNEPDPYAFESRVAHEECDQCGKPFEVDVRDDRPELILCPSCWAKEETRKVEEVIRALRVLHDAENKLPQPTSK